MWGGAGRGGRDAGNGSTNDWSGGGGGNGGMGDDSGASTFQDPFDQGGAAPGDAAAEWESAGWQEDEGMGASGSDGSGSGGGGFLDGAGGGLQPRRAPMPLPPGGQPGPQPGAAGPQPVDPAEIKRKLGMGICAIQAGVHAIQGGVIGAIFGTFSGVSEGFAAGARGKPLIQHTLLRARQSGGNFAVWIGSYQGAKCSMVYLRKKDDALNAFVAGGVAGMLPALPTRNPRVILFSALGSAGLMGSIEAASGLFGGKEH